MPGIRKLTEHQLRMAKKWDAEGYSRPEIARKLHENYGVEITRGGISKLLGPIGRGEPKALGARPVQIWLTPEQADAAREKARGVGSTQLNMGTKTGEGSISRMVREISEGVLEVRRVG